MFRLLNTVLKLIKLRVHLFLVLPELLIVVLDALKLFQRNRFILQFILYRFEFLFLLLVLLLHALVTFDLITQPLLTMLLRLAHGLQVIFPLLYLQVSLGYFLIQLRDKQPVTCFQLLVQSTVLF